MNCTENICCMPGYVHCEGDPYHCVLPEECCASHGLVYCEHSKNHPCDGEYVHDYSVGDCKYDLEVLKCYEWCCEEDEFYCLGECHPEYVPLPGY